MTDIVSATSDEAHHDTETSLTSENPPDSALVSSTSKEPDIIKSEKRVRINIFKPDGSEVPYDDHIGWGLECIVIRHGEDRALKIPFIKSEQAEDGSWSEPKPHYYSADCMALEQKAYERLYGVPGIAEYFGFESGGIAMKYYLKGSLERCLPDADESTRRRWMVEATKIIRNCHEARVLLFDIAMRNFVVSDDMTLRAIDFAAAYVLEYGVDMVIANSDGVTVKVDLFHLGCVIYSLATGTKYQADCFDEKDWPTEFPPTENITAGHVIRSSWEGRYSSAQEMLDELRASLVASPQPILYAHDALFKAATSVAASCTVQ